MGYISAKLSSKDVRERTVWTVTVFFVIFFALVIISYFLLPEGILKNKNPAQSWQEADNVLILIFQIFFYNMISVLIIIMSSLFSHKKSNQHNYLSVGYMTFFTLISINAVILGTWSFSIESCPAALPERIFQIFDITSKAALWEMIGQLMITCSVAQISVFRSYGKDLIKRKFSEIRLEKEEKLFLVIGIVMMLIGAVIEGIAIKRL